MWSNSWLVRLTFTTANLHSDFTGMSLSAGYLLVHTVSLTSFRLLVVSRCAVLGLPAGRAIAL